MNNQSNYIFYSPGPWDKLFSHFWNQTHSHTHSIRSSALHTGCVLCDKVMVRSLTVTADWTLGSLGFDLYWCLTWCVCVWWGVWGSFLLFCYELFAELSYERSLRVCVCVAGVSLTILKEEVNVFILSSAWLWCDPRCRGWWAAGLRQKHPLWALKNG